MTQLSEFPNPSWRCFSALHFVTNVKCIHHISVVIKQKEQVFVMFSVICSGLNLSVSSLGQWASRTGVPVPSHLFPYSHLPSSCLLIPLFSACPSPPFRSKWRTLLQMSPAARLPPPLLRPTPLYHSLLHCCALHLPLLPPVSSVSLLLCRLARSRTERPTTTLHLRSSGLRWPPPPLGAPASGLLLPAPAPPLQGRCLHHWSGWKWSSPTHTDTHTHNSRSRNTQISM